MSDHQTETPHVQPTRSKKTSPANPWMLSTVLLVGLVAGFGVAQVPYFKTLGGATQTAVINPTAQPSVAAAPEEPPPPVLTAEQIQNLPDDDVVTGSPDAPITLVEFSDFQCPYCSRFFLQSFQDIDANYIKTGKVKFVYRDFPLEFHPQAQPAALAAECAADQNKFIEMHDMLFTQQDQWSNNPDAAKVFQSFAKELKLNASDFASCMTAKTHDAEIKKDIIDGVTMGVTGTPGFFINGKLISGAMPYEEVFKPVFEAELAGKTWEVSYDPATRRPVVKVGE